MTEMTKIRAQVVIIGGGAFGLWFFRLCHQAGIKALLIEKKALGSNQSMASQGMIHGGQRYTLLGKVSKQAKMIAKVRDYWLDCIEGKGEVDLTKTQILSHFQYLVQPKGLLNQVSFSLVKLWMKERVRELSANQLPDWLQSQSFSFFQLDEPVIKVDTLITDLTHHLDEYILKADVKEIKFKQEDNPPQIKKIQSLICSLSNHKVEIKSDFFCFASGKGNQHHLDLMQEKWQNYMQIRPLRQFILNNPKYQFFGHFVNMDGIDSRPSLTISTHPTSNSQSSLNQCWYIGGKIATDTLEMNELQSKELLLEKLKTCFSQLKFSPSQVEIVDIDRAEPLTKDYLMPDHVEPIEIHQNAALIWPVKLTLAPLIAQNLVSRLLEKNNFYTEKNQKADIILKTFVSQQKRVQIASYPWSE